MGKIIIPKREDLLYLAELGREMHLKTAFRNVPYIPEAVASLMNYGLNNPDTYFLRIATLDDMTPVGIFFGRLEQYVCNYNRFGQDILVWVDERHRGGFSGYRLFKAWQKWLDNQPNVTDDVLTNRSGSSLEKTEAFYLKMGYNADGKTYRRILTPKET